MSHITTKLSISSTHLIIIRIQRNHQHYDIGQGDNDNAKQYNSGATTVVSYEFLWVCRTCDYIWMNANYFLLF